MGEPAATTWTIVEPGLIRLDTTEIHIRLIPDAPALFVVERAGSAHGGSGTLAGAKEHALLVLNELLQMGVDP